jgi:hypothetical protein
MSHIHDVTQSKCLAYSEDGNFHYQDQSQNSSESAQLHHILNLERWNHASGRIMPSIENYNPFEYYLHQEYFYPSQNDYSEAQNFAYSEHQHHDASTRQQHHMLPTTTDRIHLEEEEESRKPQPRALPLKRKSSKESWFDKYNELLEFQREHGHVDVPQTYRGNRSLGKWVGKQRELYKVYLGNQSSDRTLHKTCPLNDERVELLNKIGFRWAIGKGQAAKLHGIFDSSESKKVQWEQKFNLLKRFQQIHGHLNVGSTTSAASKSFEVDEAELFRWVKSQRMKFRDVQNNKISAGQVLLERFQKLTDLGLDLNTKSLLTTQEDVASTPGTSNAAGDNLKKTSVKRSELWEMRYQSLLQFIEQHGHPHVSHKQDPVLSRWVVTQREYYRALQNSDGNSYNPLTNERIERLNNLGFEFMIKDGKFDDRMKELKQFLDEKGHLNVRPWQNKPLYDWINRQRKYFKDYIEGKSSSIMTIERVSQLEKIGLDWQYVFREVDASFIKSIHNEKPNGNQQDIGSEDSDSSNADILPSTHENGCAFLEAGLIDEDVIDVNYQSDLTQIQRSPRHRKEINLEKWKKNYSDLLDFCHKHKHCRVPGRYKENPKLGAWVKLQREDYKHFKEGKRSPMDQWRIEMLQKIGFEFSIISAEERKKTWNRRLEELKEYKRSYGHCDVPQVCPGLGKWVAKIRLKYRQRNKGIVTNLTQVQIDQLLELGFKFVVSKGRTSKSWDSYFNDMLAFKAKHGHTHIPLNYTSDLSLALWAYHQRIDHTKKIEGRKLNANALSRLEKLSEVGFVFYEDVRVDNIPLNKKRKRSTEPDAKERVAHSLQGHASLEQHSSEVLTQRLHGAS